MEALSAVAILFMYTFFKNIFPFMLLYVLYIAWTRHKNLARMSW